MSEKSKKRLAEIAEQFMPGWKAVKPYASDERHQSKADASLPDLAVLRKKYFGDQTAPDSDAPEIANLAADDEDAPSGLISMEQKTPTDAKVGRKVVVVDKGKVRGVQG
jgi:hypothetical protein